MLGLILYESFELVYYISKLGYNGISNIYKWYYDLPSEEQIKYQDKIKMLEDRLKQLEESNKKD